MSKSHIFNVDIEIYNPKIEDGWRQARYLVHGYDDVLWTDDLDSALLFLKQNIIDGEADKI